MATDGGDRGGPAIGVDSIHLVVEAQDAPSKWFQTWIFGARLAGADDALDPQRGGRFEASLWRSPAGVKPEKRS